MFTGYTESCIIWPITNQQQFNVSVNYFWGLQARQKTGPEKLMQGLNTFSSPDLRIGRVCSPQFKIHNFGPYKSQN